MVENEKKQLTFPLALTYEEKQKTIFSNWSSPILTKEQIIYASFDAIGAKDLLLHLSKKCNQLQCVDCYQFCCTNDSGDSNGVTYSCSDCKKLFTKQSALEMHQREKQHGNWAVLWKCDYCLQHFYSANDLHHHENTFCRSSTNVMDPNNDLRVCNFCGEMFQTSDDLNFHHVYCFQRVQFYEKLKKERKKLSCTSKWIEKEKHSKIHHHHSPNKQAKPEKIVKKPLRISRKNIHRNNSTPSFSSNSLCCETCGLLFNHPAILKQHQRNNFHGRFYHKCGDCNRVCRYEKSLRDHQKSKSHGAYKPNRK